MASQTLMDVIEVFPVATEVGAYEAANWRTAGLPPRGAPQGSATTTATVDAGGELAFTGLAAGRAYFAAASVAGTWRYQGFTAPDDTTPTGLDERMDAMESSSAAVTRNTDGSIATVTDARGVLDEITRGTSGVESFRQYGTTYTVARDSAGRITEVTPA